MSVFQTLKERGFIAQLTHEETIKKYWKTKKLLFISDLTPLQTACM